jgi:dGTPase
VRDLFGRYLSRPEDMPRVHRERAAREPLHRLVCDYIAGMTDKYLLRRHAELFGK